MPLCEKTIAYFLSKTENFCSFCSVVLESEAAFAAHCRSEMHQLLMLSDQGRDWKHRAPVRGVGSNQYSLCAAFSKSGKCRFGDFCCDAHGDDELSEWKIRFHYRQSKLQGAHESKLHGRPCYAEQFRERLEKHFNSRNPQNILYEHLDSVKLTYEPELSLSFSEKNCCKEWTFRLSSKRSLRHIALLHENQCDYFRISSVKCLHFVVPEYDLGANCQEWSNPHNYKHLVESYIIKVQFVTTTYGRFCQAIIFDFGSEPVLYKTLQVSVVGDKDRRKIKAFRQFVLSSTERWLSPETQIIEFKNKEFVEQEKIMLSWYPAPSDSNFKFTTVSLESSSMSTYNPRQHELLYIEEMAQYDLLAKYNIQAILSISDKYFFSPNSGCSEKYSVGGELFAVMKLPTYLSEDSSYGRLVLSSCNTVLIAPITNKGEQLRKVYEAVIQDKGKNIIFIRLSKQCCKNLELSSGQRFLAEVQFQLNRLPLCEMHFAVDELRYLQLVFPNVSVTPQMSNNPVTLSDLKLNPKQKEAVLAITAPLAPFFPPVLIIGPFGTGKTYTLAQAVRALLDQKESRILVCTHSNSAADIYVKEYFHPTVCEGRYEATPLRIYYRNRWISTVNGTVQHYSLPDGQRFRMPTIEDVEKHKVVVTTLSTAKYLVQLKLEKGYFTHILIDEAAQAMECEVLMALSLANKNTRIVLAGDHEQLSPEGYSDFVKRRNLQTSLLERLNELYPEDYCCKILLSQNYRSHKAIIQYTSELFYDNRLEASGMQPSHTKYFPLTFFAAKGVDVQDSNSTAFHNNAEVYEIVDRIQELKSNWPEYWGDQEDTSIGVVTPYYDQVVRIRSELRKRKVKGVSVERVHNVQGKQFRALFISIVRTRYTCSSYADPSLDFAFLTNAKLLNTAITRAQSLVAVVGDPVSLCAVGKCRKIWEKFLLTCHEEKSLFGITWDSIQTELGAIERSKNFSLNKNATKFIPGVTWCNI